MSSLSPVSRRTILAGGLSAAVAALAGPLTPDGAGPGSASGVTGGRGAGRFGAADEVPLDYDSPEAFALAEQAYLEMDSEHNEAGMLAWGESYYLNGLLLMYRAHGEQSYLDQFESRVEHVLARTDRARGVTDYSGRSGPVWRAAGNYTAGHGELALADGSPGIQVRWAGTVSHEAHATVTPGDDGRFDLLLEHPTSTITLTGLSLEADDADYVVPAVNGIFTGTHRWTAVDRRQEPAGSDELAASEVDFEPQFYVFSVHTGMLILPMARYVRLVRSTDELSARGPFATRLLRAVREAARFHDGEFAVDAEGRGDFWWARDAPIPWDGMMQPYNQAHAMGSVYAELYAITGSQRYRSRLETMLASLQAGLVEDGEALIWPYWQPWEAKYRGYGAEEDLSSYTPHYSGIPVAEDISHAAITLEFIQATHDAGVADLSQWRRRIGIAFTQNVILDAETVWRRIDGTEEAAEGHWAQLGRWLMLDDVEPEIRAQTLRVYQAGALVPSQGSHALVTAYLNFTA